jgi:hypothetical protein
VQVLGELPTVLPGVHLQFCTNPGGFRKQAENAEDWTDLDLALTPNTGFFALTPSANVNQSFILVEMRLWEIHRLLSSFDRNDDVEETKDEIVELLRRMEREKRNNWIDQQTQDVLHPKPFINTST